MGLPPGGLRTPSHPHQAFPWKENSGLLKVTNILRKLPLQVAFQLHVPKGTVSTPFPRQLQVSEWGRAHLRVLKSKGAGDQTCSHPLSLVILGGAGTTSPGTPVRSPFRRSRGALGGPQPPSPAVAPRTARSPGEARPRQRPHGFIVCGARLANRAQGAQRARRRQNKEAERARARGGIARPARRETERRGPSARRGGVPAPARPAKPPFFSLGVEAGPGHPGGGAASGPGRLTPSHPLSAAPTRAAHKERRPASAHLPPGGAAGGRRARLKGPAAPRGLCACPAVGRGGTGAGARPASPSGASACVPAAAALARVPAHAGPGSAQDPSMVRPRGGCRLRRPGPRCSRTPAF